MIKTTPNTTFCSIKGSGERHLGYAFPGDLFIELVDIQTQDDCDAAVIALAEFEERKCWLLLEEGNEMQKSIAQRAGYFWIWHGVWYKSDFSD